MWQQINFAGVPLPSPSEGFVAPSNRTVAEDPEGSVWRAAWWPLDGSACS
jgi:hypothetical protein